MKDETANVSLHLDDVMVVEDRTITMSEASIEPGFICTNKQELQQKHYSLLHIYSVSTYNYPE